MTKRSKPIDLQLTLFATWGPKDRPEFLALAPNADWADGYIAGFHRASTLGLNLDLFDTENATVVTGDEAMAMERERIAS